MRFSLTDKIQLQRFEEANLIGRLVRLLKQIGDAQIQENLAMILEYLALKCMFHHFPLFDFEPPPLHGRFVVLHSQKSRSYS